MTQPLVNHDVLHRFTLANDQLRGEITSLEKTFKDATAHQNLPLAVQTLLGEFLAASALLGEVLKFEGTLTLQVRGDGSVPLIMAEATSARTLRGIAKLGEGVDANTLEQQSFKQMVGQGVLTLTIDPTKGQRYQGIVPIDGDNLADCLTHYFSQSEQLPTRLWLSAENGVAAGLFLQQLPASDNVQNTDDLWQTAEQLAATVKPSEFAELAHESVLYRLFHELEVTLFSEKPVSFACSCTPERSANALVVLGEQDALALVQERGLVEMDCDFCGAHYQFEEADVKALFGTQITRH